MSEFVEYLSEVFNEFGPVTTRKMFGGHGLYHDGIMFGLIADNTLYLKADKKNELEFVQRELPPFQYQKGDKLVAMSYYLAPEEIFDDPEVARSWALSAFEAGLRAKKKR